MSRETIESSEHRKVVESSFQSLFNFYPLIVLNRVRLRTRLNTLVKPPAFPQNPESASK